MNKESNIFIEKKQHILNDFTANKDGFNEYINV